MNDIDSLKVIHDPLSLVSSVFSDSFTARGSYDSSWPDRVPARFQSLLNTDTALSHVPLLTASALRRGALPVDSLVRYVGMVQDSFDPEWFTATARRVDGSSQQLVPCAFRDALPDGFEVDQTILERR